MLTHTEITRLIGTRIRIARCRVVPKMSQGALGAAIGISFQQVQKYESGKDRVSASRLVQIAEATSQSIPFFFEDALAACEAQVEQVAA